MTSDWDVRGRRALLGLMEDVPEGADVHVYPVDDLRPHDTEHGGDCWCKPVNPDDAPRVWVHNSMDGREDYESGGKSEGRTN